MKTTPWTPPKLTENEKLAFDDIVIFSCNQLSFEKSGSLLSSMLAGAHYATMGLPFSIYSSEREELVRFVPGNPVQGLPGLTQAMLEIGIYMDKMAKDAQLVVREQVLQHIDAAFAEQLGHMRVEIEAQVRAELGAPPRENIAEGTAQQASTEDAASAPQDVPVHLPSTAQEGAVG